MQLRPSKAWKRHRGSAQDRADPPKPESMKLFVSMLLLQESGALTSTSTYAGSTWRNKNTNVSDSGAAADGRWD